MADAFPGPPELDAFNDDDDSSYQVHFQETLCQLGEQTTLLLNEVDKGNAEALTHMTRERLDHCYTEWLHALVYEHFFYKRVEMFRFADDRSVLSSCGMQVFIELSRMHYLLEHERWQREHRELLALKEPPDASRDYHLLWTLSQTKSHHWVDDNWTSVWKTPVARFTQRQIYDALMQLSECLLDFPDASPDALEDFNRFVYVLMTHNCRFFSVQCTDELLDMPEMRHDAESLCYYNRDYAMFCSVYFGAILKRQVYHELFYAKRMTLSELALDVERAARNVRQWLENVVGKALGEEGFDDCYTNVVDTAYACPGDDDWFAYKEPQMTFSRGAVLNRLRPHLAKRYYSEERANPHTVWDAALQYKHGGVAREFVLEALDIFMRMQYNLHWKSAIVITHDEIEHSQVKLFRAETPLLIQVFSRYWTYDQFAYAQDIAYVWPCNNIYETIAVWFHQCYRNYGGRVFNVNLGPLIERALHYNPEMEQLENNMFVL